jgi:hypothetical protein
MLEEIRQKAVVGCWIDGEVQEQIESGDTIKICIWERDSKSKN